MSCLHYDFIFDFILKIKHAKFSSLSVCNTKMKYEIFFLLFLLSFFLFGFVKKYLSLEIMELIFCKFIRTNTFAFICYMNVCVYRCVSNFMFKKKI